MSILIVILRRDPNVANGCNDRGPVAIGSSHRPSRAWLVAEIERVSEPMPETIRPRSRRKIIAVSIGRSSCVATRLRPHAASIAGRNDAAPFRSAFRAHGDR
jgi:hypothetical protein